MRIFFLSISFISVVGCSQELDNPRESFKVPKESKVTQAKIVLVEGTSKNGSREEITLNNADTATLLHLLQEVLHEPYPGKWEMMGYIELKLSDGLSMYYFLYVAGIPDGDVFAKSGRYFRLCSYRDFKLLAPSLP